MTMTMTMTMTMRTIQWRGATPEYQAVDGGPTRKEDKGKGNCHRDAKPKPGDDLDENLMWFTTHEKHLITSMRREGGKAVRMLPAKST